MSCSPRILAILASSALSFAAAVPAQQQAASAPSAPTPIPVAGAQPPGATSPDAPMPPAPEVDAQSWVLMDYASGQILASKDPDQRVEPASITKIMTDYVISAEIANGKLHLDDPVFISESAWRGGGAGTDGSTSFLKLNSQVPLKDLLYGLIIQSGNDAAIALAEHAAGSEPAFAGLMNAYAKQLGMVNTHFANASGYPIPDHYTTAHDIALLSRALIHNFPDDYAISSIKEFKWNGITQHNRNTLLWRDPTVDGIKTGHTQAAGFCLAASAKHDDSRMIAIVMHSSSEKSRANAAMALLNYGFRFYESHKLYEAGKPLATPRVWKGAQDHLPVGVTEDAVVTVQRGKYDKLKASLDINQPLIAPIRKGQQVGVLHVEEDGHPVTDIPLVAQAEVAKAGFFGRLWDSFLLLFHHSGSKKS